MNKKEIAKIEAEIKRLQNQLYNLAESKVPPSVEYYTLMRWNIEKSISDLEIILEREIEHEKMMKPFIYTNYLFVFLVAAFITYFLLMSL